MHHWGCASHCICALCQSILQYCVSVWGSSAKTILLSLERAQRAVIKVMLWKPLLFSTDSLYRISKLLSVRRLYILKAAIRGHETVNLPNYAQLLTKRTFRVPLPSYNSALAKRSPDFMHMRIYNNICKMNSVQIPTTSKFKAFVKKWLVSLNYHETEALLLGS